MSPQASGDFEASSGLVGESEKRSKTPTAKDLGLSHAEMRSYSLMRAVDASATGDWSKAGFERQVSLAIANFCKKKPVVFHAT